MHISALLIWARMTDYVRSAIARRVADQLLRDRQYRDTIVLALELAGTQSKLGNRRMAALYLETVYELERRDRIAFTAIFSEIRAAA